MENNRDIAGYSLVDFNTFHFNSVQSLSRVCLFATHESQHARPPCWSTPRVDSNSCPSSWWCHPAISSSVVPFSSCPQSLPASESFPMSQLFTWGGQSTGVSALASFLPKKSQGWSPSWSKSVSTISTVRLKNGFIYETETDPRTQNRLWLPRGRWGWEEWVGSMGLVVV